MRKTFILLLGILTTGISQAQEQYLGMASSPRGGIYVADLNPAELSNMYHKYEVGIFSFSAGASNDRVNIFEFETDDNTQLILDLFKGNHTTNARVDANVRYPSFAMKINKWGIGLNVQSHAKGGLFDTSYQTDDFSLRSSNTNNAALTANINTNGNSRFTLATWSEVNLTTSRTVFENEGHRFNAGLTLKLLFPATYMNVSVDQFSGVARYDANTELVTLTGVPNTTMNIDYTGDNASKIFGTMGGFGTDIGFSYTLKDSTEFNRINIGLAIKNIGSLNYKTEDGSNGFNSYVFNTQITPLDFNQISNNNNINNVSDFGNELVKSGVLTTKESATSRKVSLPTVFIINSDFKVVPRFHVGVYAQFNLKDPKVDYVIPTQNVYAVTPRYASKYFDVYSTWAKNEITGVSGGLGFRIGGFHIGSRSLITGLSKGDQIDVNIGARLAFGK